MGANDIKVRDKVVVVEGPYQGSEGAVEEIYRQYDREAKTHFKTVAIAIAEDNHIETRLAFVRKV
jgi:ribosomal protein L24